MSRRTAALLVLAVSTAAGLYFATQLQLAYPESVRTSWRNALGINLTFYWLWGAAVPLIVILARRFPLDMAHWRRSVPVHFLLGAVLTVAHLAIGGIIAGTAIYGWKGKEPLDAVVYNVLHHFHTSYPTYGVILLLVTAWRAAKLEARLAEARLEALRAQLRPHFLFNTLNSVSSLMYRDVAAADSMIAHLADLLRVTLRSDQRKEIALREELALLGRYLDIESIRFADRLQVDMNVPDECLSALVPPFLLQPLAENAVHHAVAPRPEGGRVAIAAQVADGRLVIRVSDDGPGLPPGGAAPGVGLSNTRARLAELYGAAARLELEDREGGGVDVVVTIPHRP